MGTRFTKQIASTLKRRGWSRRRTLEVLWAYTFLAPALIFFLVLVVWPMIHALIISFHKWWLLPSEKPFVGIANYAAALRDPLTLKSLKVTLLYTVAVVPIGGALSLGLALILNNRQIRALGFFRTVYFIPVITTWAAVGFIWRWLFEPSFGLVNTALGLLGVTGPGWLVSPNWALPAIIMTSIWKGMGYNMVIFLAGLQNVPRQYYEAAQIDGANIWQCFWKITLPLLNAVLVFVIVTSIISSFQVFTPIIIMTKVGGAGAGGPLDTTRVLVYHIYDLAFRRGNVGFASAVAFILFAMVMIVTVIHLRLVQREVEY